MARTLINNFASAYELAVDAGFVGTEGEWLASLKGADGKPVKGGLRFRPGYVPGEVPVTTILFKDGLPPGTVHTPVGVAPALVDREQVNASNAYEKFKCIRLGAGNVGDGQTETYIITLPNHAGDTDNVPANKRLRIMFRSESEPGDVFKARVDPDISGIESTGFNNQYWSDQSVAPFGSLRGTRKLTLSYEKNSSGSEYADAVWVARIQYPEFFALGDLVAYDDKFWVCTAEAGTDDGPADDPTLWTAGGA